MKRVTVWWMVLPLLLVMNGLGIKGIPGGDSTFGGGSAPNQGEPRLRACGNLPERALTIEYECLHYSGLSPTQAETLFNQAMAAIYLSEKKELLLLSSSGVDHPSWAYTFPAKGEVLGPFTLPSFLEELSWRYPEIETSPQTQFLIKFPSTAAVPSGVLSSSANKKEKPAVSVALSEDFESGLSRWDIFSNDSSYFWGLTHCSPCSGAYCADGVRGGSIGSGLTCDANYPASLNNWLVDNQCENIYNASEAWLDFDLRVTTDPAGFIGDTIPSNHFAVYYMDSSDTGWGWAFWGNFVSWFHITTNLRQWYYLGDLTQRSCNQVAFVFTSGSLPKTGFGARVDNVLVSAGGVFPCGISATTFSGAAPLTVYFSVNYWRELDSTQYAWHFGDGTHAAGPDVFHTYTTPGKYYVELIVLYNVYYCNASVEVDVSSVKPGDINGDGKIDNSDLQLYAAFLAGNISESQIILGNAHETGSTTINAVFLVKIAGIVGGIIPG